MTLNPTLPDLGSEHQTEPVPPEPYCLVADINAAFEKKILDLTEPQRISDLYHRRKADNFVRTVEITEGILHPSKLGNEPTRLKPIWSDSAHPTVGRD